MAFKKFRWSQVYESSEEELTTLLQARKIGSERVHIEAASNLDTQQTGNATTLWCAEGSLMAKTETNTISLQPGDALRFEANTQYSIQPGIAGCTYYLTK